MLLSSASECKAGLDETGKTSKKDILNSSPLFSRYTCVWAGEQALPLRGSLRLLMLP